MTPAQKAAIRAAIARKYDDEGDQRTLQDIDLVDESIIPALDALDAAEKANEELKARDGLAEALAFYASIVTHLHGPEEQPPPFLSDWETVSNEYGLEYYVPGKRARAALDAYQKAKE